MNAMQWVCKQVLTSFIYRQPDPKNGLNWSELVPEPRPKKLDHEKAPRKIYYVKKGRKPPAQKVFTDFTQQVVEKMAAGFTSEEIAKQLGVHRQVINKERRFLRAHLGWPVGKHLPRFIKKDDEK